MNNKFFGRELSRRDMFVVLLGVCAGLALLSVFSLQTGAQANPSVDAPSGVTLLSAHDSGTNDDGITNRAANQIFTFTVSGSFTETGSVALQITDPDGTAVSGTFSKTVASGETSSINVDVGADTLTKEGEYTVTATQTATVGSGEARETLTSDPSSEYTFTIDRIAPTVSGETLITNNSNDNTLAKESEIITLTFTASETLASAPSVTIAGQTVTATGSGSPYTAVVTVTSSTTEGAVAYSIATLTDVAGNTFSPTAVTLTGTDEVVVDLTDPTLTVLRTSGTGTDARTVTAFASDTNGIRAFEVADGETTCTAVGTTSATFEAYESNTSRDVEANTEDCFRATDNAGNASYVSTADAEQSASGPPFDVTLLPAHDSGADDDVTNRAANQIFTFTVGGFFTEGGSIDLQITDPDSVAVSGTFSKTVGSGETTSINVDVGANTLTKEGEYTVTATQTVSEETTDPSPTYTFTIDRTAPTVSGETLITNNSNDNTLAKESETITLTFTVSETLTSAPSVTIAGQTVTATGSGSPYTAVVTVTSSTNEGAVTYDIGVLTDVATNTRNPDSVTLTGTDEVVVDLTNPTLAILRTSGAGTEARTVTASASDTNGIRAFEVADGETTCTAVGTATATFEAYESNTSRDVEATTEDCFRATDNAGNVSYASTVDALGGVGLVTYTNSDGTPATADNLLKTSTFTIASTTNASTDYRLFVREAGGDWLTTPTASGTSTASGTFSDSLTRSDNDYEVAFQTVVGGGFVPALASLIAISNFSVDTIAPTFTLAHQSTANLVQNTAYYNTTGLTTGGVTVSNVVEENLATAVLTLARTDISTAIDITPTPTINTSTNAVSFANLTSILNGIYTATVVLTDGVGNATTETLNLVVDTAAPTITGVTIDDPSARRFVEATIAVTHNQTIQETLTSTFSGQDCNSLNTITITGSGNTTTDVQLRGPVGTFNCTIILTDHAGNVSNSFTIPTFTIERNSNGGGGGGGGGVDPGKYVESPTFEADPQPPTPPLPPVEPAPVPAPQASIPILPTLICGAEGERVRILQQFLNQNGYLVAAQGPGSPGQETTYFGLATERALKEYQIANGLPPTSILDAQTQAHIHLQGVQIPQTLQTLQTPQPAPELETQPDSETEPAPDSETESESETESAESETQSEPTPDPETQPAPTSSQATEVKRILVGLLERVEDMVAQQAEE